MRVGGLIGNAFAGLGDHVRRGVGADDAGEVRRQCTRDRAWATAKVETQAPWPAVIGEDGVVEGGRISRAEGCVGRGGEGGLSAIRVGRVSLAVGNGDREERHTRTWPC